MMEGKVDKVIIFIWEFPQNLFISFKPSLIEHLFESNRVLNICNDKLLISN